ncbi:hypothetical protein BC628DRAFT_14482 [Trametes gibbosa]|nr:hypothetical protein BC628DRAFT_14482 [Trametes gibbosa]
MLLRLPSPLPRAVQAQKKGHSNPDHARRAGAVMVPGQTWCACTTNEASMSSSSEGCYVVFDSVPCAPPGPPRGDMYQQLAGADQLSRARRWWKTKQRNGHLCPLLTDVFRSGEPSAAQRVHPSPCYFDRQSSFCVYIMLRWYPANKHPRIGRHATRLALSPRRPSSESGHV